MMESYPQLSELVRSLLEGEDELICAMANTAAVLYHSLPDLNWAGFYRAREGGLILGPFQGKPACTRIPCGKGVCGTAMATGRPQLVPDVHRFPGHIACDSASSSELVLPLYGAGGAFLGVLDLDSPTPGRFTQADLDGLLPVAALFARF